MADHRHQYLVDHRRLAQGGHLRRFLVGPLQAVPAGSWDGLLPLDDLADCRVRACCHRVDWASCLVLVYLPVGRQHPQYPPLRADLVLDVYSVVWN